MYRDQLFKHDKSDKVVYVEYDSGAREWHNYTDAGESVLIRDNLKNSEEFLEYDNHGRRIHYRYTDRYTKYEEWKKYDSQGRQIYNKVDNKYELSIEYKDNSAIYRCRSLDGRNICGECELENDIIHFIRNSPFHKGFNSHEEFIHHLIHFI